MLQTCTATVEVDDCWAPPVSCSLLESLAGITKELSHVEQPASCTVRHGADRFTDAFICCKIYYFCGLHNLHLIPFI